MNQIELYQDKIPLISHTDNGLRVFHLLWLKSQLILHTLVSN